MPIPSYLLDRIRLSALSGPQVADAFIELAHAADAAESAECAIRIEYLGNGDTPQPGDLVPTIILSLERQRP
jgi:hypothetical protein